MLQNQITKEHPIAKSSASNAKTKAIGYLMGWKLTPQNQLDENSVVILVRNIGQLVREKNDAGFLLLQDIPAEPLRKPFISTLNEALQGTNWKIADDSQGIASGSQSGVLTLYNTSIYSQVQKPATKENVTLPEPNKEHLISHQVHWFKKVNANVDAPGQIVTVNTAFNINNAANNFYNQAPEFGSTNNLSVSDNFVPFAYVSDNLGSSFGSSQVYENYYKTNNQTKLSEFNHPNAAVYDVNAPWKDEDVNTILRRNPNFFPLKDFKPSEGAKYKNGTLSLYLALTNVDKVDIKEDLVSVLNALRQLHENFEVNTIDIFEDTNPEVVPPSNIRIAIPLRLKNGHISSLLISFTLDTQKLINNHSKIEESNFSTWIKNLNITLTFVNGESKNSFKESNQLLQALTFLNQNLQLDQVANDESNFPYSQTHKNSGIVAAIDCEQFLENKTDLINDDLVCQKTQEYNKNYQLEFPDLEQIKKEKSENKGDPENKSPSKAEQWNKGLQQADKDRGIRLNYQGELRAYLKRLKFKIESNGDNLRIVDSDKRLVLSIKLSEKDGKTSTDITFAPGEATDKKAIKASLLVRLAYGDFNPSPYSAEPALSLKIPESSEVSYIEAMKELNYIFRQKIFNDENVNISYGSAPSPKPSFDPSSLPGFG